MLAGNAPISEINEWHKGTEMKINAARPGASDVLEWASAQDEDIAFHAIGVLSQQSKLAHRLNSELCALMVSNFRSRAWTHTLAEKATDSLTAWRNVYRELNNVTPSQVRAEHSFLSNPPDTPQVADLTTWVAALENKIDDLVKVNPDCQFSDTQRRNIVVNVVDKDKRHNRCRGCTRKSFGMGNTQKSHCDGHTSQSNRGHWEGPYDNDHADPPRFRA